MLVVVLMGCGSEAPVVVDAGGGCIVTRPPPSAQQCQWSASTSSATACDTQASAANPDAGTCENVSGGPPGCFSTATCQRVCGVQACNPSSDPTAVRCGLPCE